MKTNKLLFLLLLLPFLSFGQVSTYPDKADFENGFGNWLNPVGDDFDWTWKLGSGTTSSGTGPQTMPYGADNSDGYIYTESSSPNYPNKQAWLECSFDMSSLSDATFSFSYHNYSSNGGSYGPGTLSLDVFDGTSWTYGIWSSSTSFNGWQDAVVDLTAYAGQSLVILSFTGYTVGYQSDMCLDNLSVDGTGGGGSGGGGPPACATLDYSQDFETGTTQMTATTSTQSQAGVDAVSANGSLYGLHMQGNSYTGWSSSYSTGELAFTTSPTHVASVARTICASTASGVTLTFDKLQTYTFRETYSWFRLTVNGVAIPDIDGIIYHSAIVGNACGAWESKQYDLTPYASAEFIVAFEGCMKYYDGYTTTGCGGDNVYIDNILISESSTTPPPSTPSSITGQVTPNGGASLTYSVVNVSTVDTYDWTVPSGWSITAGQGSSSITVTTGTTSGDVSVTATNVGGTSSASTLAVAPVAIVTSFPYSTDFENETQHSVTASATGFTFAATGWRNVDGDDGDWRADKGGTGSQGTGPGNGGGSGQPDHNPGTADGYYLYIESSSPNYPSKEFILWSPPYDLTSMTAPTLTFWYSMYSASGTTFSLQYSTDNGTVFQNLGFMCTTVNPIDVVYQNMGTSWRQGLVDLSSLGSSTNIMFRFVVTTGTSFDSDVCLDDIKLVDASSTSIDVGENITLGSSAYDNAYGLILSGSSAQTITPAGYSVENLTINNSSGVIVSGSNLVVDGTLTLTDGVIATGSNSVIVTSTSASALSGGSSTAFINGTLRRHISANTDTYSFPIGQGSGPTNYFRADLINNNMNLPGSTDFIQMSVAAEAETGNNIDANLIATNYGTSITNIAENAIWTISPSMGGSFLSGDYGVNLHTANIAGLTDNFFTVLKRSSTSTTYADWDCFATTTTIPAAGQPGRTISDGYAQRSGFTSFSKFGVGWGFSELPIELLYFRAKVVSNEHVRLEWETLSEFNNERFDIERSEDGNSWHIIGYVDGNGTTNESLKYSYDDRFPLNGISYYRFRQVDADGAWAYSNIVVVKLMGEDEEPIYIFDVIGRVIWTGVDYLPNGVYFFQYEDGRTERVLINKKRN